MKSEKFVIMLLCMALGWVNVAEAQRDLTCRVKGVSFTMKYVEGGTFNMGCNDSDASDSEKPVHSVTVSSFYMGETEVTKALWKTVMGDNAHNLDGDDLPIEQVSWNNCQAFINKLNRMTGKKFRLPTEAEWEYAARGGKKSRNYKYAGSNDIDKVAWYYNEDAWYTNIIGAKSHSVKTKSPNELGLYDMSGNVWELCQDHYGDYDTESQTDPQGPSSGCCRVLRGGCYIHEANNCRVSSRIFCNPDEGSMGEGFRLVLPCE